MKVRVIQGRCQGHLRCAAVAPELFAGDDLGYAKEIGDGVVPAGLEPNARLAESNCPEQAIEISGEP